MTSIIKTAILLIGPGLSILIIAFTLLLILVASFLFISFSGVLAIVSVLTGILFIVGSIIIWPVRKHAQSIISALVAWLISEIITRYRKEKK